MKIFLDSSMVEHSAVNRGVVGSSPTRGVFLYDIVQFWLLGQAVKTSPFHGGNTGSIPVGVISVKSDFILDDEQNPCYNKEVLNIWRHSQVVRHRSATPLSPVQIWLSPLKKPFE